MLKKILIFETSYFIQKDNIKRKFDEIKHTGGFCSSTSGAFSSGSFFSSSSNIRASFSSSLPSSYINKMIHLEKL